MSSRGDKLFGAWFIIIGAASLAWLGLMGWLIVSLVGWVTSK